MKIELTSREVQILLTALRILRGQQQAASLVLEGLIHQDQVQTGIRMVTDLETKLAAAKKSVA